ncbi:MAG: ATP-binding cassette domain-containing protein [Gemmatimonadales bacterium]|nr:MAG: ATP-binding cassette domain-containing protein [Gemmatimonadales bacterium]
MAQPVIYLEGVNKAFGTNTAVRDLDFELPRGTVCGLLGPNGAGKTTAIRMILDILGPDSGRIEVFGERVTPEVRDRIGYLPEERGMYQKMRVAEHLGFFGEIKGMRHADAMREAGIWLERLGLSDRATDRVENLSKGMQQKVQFIATVLHGPELLILDEPFSGLDPINADLLREIVVERKSEGATVLFSTHMIDDAERICDRVCMISGARKVLDGTLAEVKGLSGRRNVVIECEGDRAFLKHELVEAATDHGRQIGIRLRDGADPQALLRAAVDSGVRIDKFEIADPSLREVFLEHAGAHE